jgi:acetyl-CoA carboxylase/biotin carboxylase 1
METLRELSDSRYTVFDVLPAFFANEDPWVTLGTLARTNGVNSH